MTHLSDFAMNQSIFADCEVPFRARKRFKTGAEIVVDVDHYDPEDNTIEGQIVSMNFAGEFFPEGSTIRIFVMGNWEVIEEGGGE